MLCCTIYKSIPIYICGICYYRDNNLHLHTIVIVTIPNGNQGKLIVFGIGRWRRRRAFQIIFLRYFVPLANDNDITTLDIRAISDTSAPCLVMLNASVKYFSFVETGEHYFYDADTETDPRQEYRENVSPGKWR